MPLASIRDSLKTLAPIRNNQRTVNQKIPRCRDLRGENGSGVKHRKIPLPRRIQLMVNGLSDCLWSQKVFISTLLKPSRVRAPLLLTDSQLPRCIRKIAVHCVDKNALETPEKWALKIKSHHLIILRSNLQLANERFPCFEAMRFFSTFLPSRIALNASRILKERG